MTLSRRSVLASTAAAGAAVATGGITAPSALAASPAILKPTPADLFHDYGTTPR